jgi:hypothetical protein
MGNVNVTGKDGRPGELLARSELFVACSELSSAHSRREPSQAQ